MNETEENQYLTEATRPFQRIAELILKSREVLTPDSPIFKTTLPQPTPQTDTVSIEKQSTPIATNPIDQAFSEAFPGTTIKPPLTEIEKKKRTVDQLFDDAAKTLTNQ